MTLYNDYSIYRHANTGQEYWGRDAATGALTTEPTGRAGWERNGVLDHRTAVYLVQDGIPMHAVWVGTDLLWEQSPSETESMNVVSSDYDEVTVADDPPYDPDIDGQEPAGGWPYADEQEIDEVLATPSTPITPSIYAYLREMTYSVASAMVELAETVNNPTGKEHLVRLENARAMLEDEIRRLSDKEE